MILDNPSYHVFGVAESRLGPKIHDNIVEIDGYNTIRQDRNTEGGGIILYIQNSLRATVLANSNTTNYGKQLMPEYLMCRVWGANLPPVFVCLIYRPPKVSFSADPNFIPTLRDLCSDYSHKIIMGDLNADQLNNTTDTRFLNNLFNEMSLQIVKHEATHRPNGETKPTTWIDAIYVDKNDEILSHNNIPPRFKSRHNLIDVEISMFIPKRPLNTFTYRKFKDFTPEDINEALVKCDWTPFQAPSDEINILLDCLNTNLQTTIDELAPLKTINPKTRKHPWVNKELQFLINKRNATEKRYIRTKNKTLLTDLIRLNEQVEHLTDVAKNSFLHDRLDEAITNGQDFWRELKHLGLLPNPRSDLHGFSPDELNSHFSKVCFSDSEDRLEMTDIILSASDDGFKLREVTLSEVILAVKHFNSQATGVDGIPHIVIAKSLPTIGPHLVRIFNNSIKNGIFPTSWKTSLLVALKKIPILTLPSDFRPIALLCFLSKVLEKLVYDQLVPFLENGKLLDPLQTGFRKYSSTETALLKLTDDIRLGISKRFITILLQFDFSKAFDTVSPTKLLKRLKELGFSKSALIWFKSYLEDRQLKVSSKTSISESRDINLGVPQGSVLGPLLFCIYMNDIKDHLDQGVYHLLYADDLQVYVQVPPECMHEGISKLNAVANSISRWTNLVSLQLNPKKTKAIYFGSDVFIDRLDKLNLPGIDMGGGVVIPFVQEVKSLGVILDCRLSWEPHILSVEKKVNRVLYTLRFIRHCTSETLRKRLIDGLITPHLDYCSVILLDAGVGLKDRIQRLSNIGVRYIFGISRDTHISPYRKRLNWLTTNARRLYFCNIILYKILRMNQPNYLSDLFTRNKPKDTAGGNYPQKS